MNKKILSIDGGGVRGIIALQFLKNLENEKNIKISEYFDAFAGTSTGALIVILLSYFKYSASEILENVYNVDNLSSIMHSSWWHRLFSFKAKYTDVNKLKLISSLFDNKDPSIYDVDKHLMVVAYNPITKQPILFRNYFDQPNYSLLDICNATSAAPTIYPMAKIRVPNTDSEFIWGIDGGVYCNNPSNIIYQDIYEMYPDCTISLLSLGTGITKPVLTKNVNPNIGKLEWLIEDDIFDIIMDSNQLASHYQTRRMCIDNHHHYLRINKYLELASNLIDNVSQSNHQNLIIEGNNWWEQYKNHDFIKFI